MVEVLKGFGLHFRTYTNVRSDSFKAAVRANLAELSAFAYNLYWSRSSAGLKDFENGRDTHHFLFSASTARDPLKLAVAAKCAEISAPQTNDMT